MKEYIITFLTYDGRLLKETVESGSPQAAKSKLRNCREVCNVEVVEKELQPA